jgi:hypothetical protein
VIYQMNMRATRPEVSVSVSIVIVKIEEMPSLRIPERMPGKPPSLLKSDKDLIDRFLSRWFESTHAVRCGLYGRPPRESNALE